MKTLFTIIGILIWLQTLGITYVLGKIGLEYLDSALNGPYIRWQYFKFSFMVFTLNVVWVTISFFLGYWLIFG